MLNDKFSNPIYQENDLINLIYQNNTMFDNIIVEPTDSIKEFELLSEINFKKIDSSLYELNINEFDIQNQNNWFIPDEYKKMDIEEYLIHACPKENYQRLVDELEEFRVRNMLPLLKVLKYIVDTLHNNNIMWGVGRGSSVSSYVLYLIGVHKIDSIKYNLNWQEFLR